MRERQGKHSTVTAVILASAILLLSQAASAYAFKTTSGGKDVRWNSNHMNIVLDSSLSALGPIHRVEKLVIAAFDEWVDVAELPIEFSFSSGDCNGIGYSPIGANENCVMADHSIFEDSAAAARSFVSYSDGSGIIMDGDIVIKSTESNWSLNGNGSGLDLRAAVLHEVGHVLGLAHSDVEESVMAPELETNETVESLFNDDIVGAQVLYEGMDEYGGLNCSTTAVGSGSWSFFLCFLIFVVVLRSGITKRIRVGLKGQVVGLQFANTHCKTVGKSMEEQVCQQ